MRYITTWRKPAPDMLDWDHHVSEDKAEAERVIENIKSRGVHQYHTFELGPQVKELSSAY